MREKLVTVVVPIYNVEKYLNCCLESIVNQTYKNLEIILVDDGSPDYCPVLCDEWAKRDSRIQVIHKENQGLGMARNTGIEHANGEYICFFDSDDYVDVQTIEKALEKAEQNRAEIVVYGFQIIHDESGVKSACTPITEKNVFTGSEVQDEFLPDLIDNSFAYSKMKSVPFSACTCLFSMSLVKRTNWRFVSEREIISEDSYSLMNLYRHVNKVYVLNVVFYYYRMNYSSLSRSFKEDRFEKTKSFAKKTIELANECGYSEKTIYRVCGLFYNFTIDIMKQIVVSNNKLSYKIKCIKEIVHDRYLRDCLKKCKYDKTHIAKSVLKIAIMWKMTYATYVLLYLKASQQNARKTK